LSSPDWQALRVSVNDRAAIYAETFPGQLAKAGQAAIGWFTHDQARALLYTFAGAWPTLGRDSNDSPTRYVYLATDNDAYRFRAIELAPGAIVVDDISPA
jgi:hypothetical protein